jgi:nucleoprotein TPR
MSMRTRRKSKAAAAAAAELDAESVALSDAGTASQTRLDFSVTIPDDLDFDYLSRVLPDVSFETPSPDTVLSLYRLVVTQADSLETANLELEESRAENERKDVELDQALQDRESSASSMEAQVKGLQEELTKVKQDRDTLGRFGVTVFRSRLMPRLLSVIKKQPRVANFYSEQHSICLVYGN